MKLYSLALSLGTMLALGSSLQATTVVYNYAFGGLGYLNSSTHTFAPVGGVGPTVTATGFTGMGSGSNLSSMNLYSKGVGSFPIVGDESGLGLTNDGDHEIKPGSFIMLDLFNLDKLGLTSLSLNVESSTDTEKWEIWASNTVPAGKYSAPASPITGTSEGNQNISSLDGYRYIFLSTLSPRSGNVLLGGLSASVDPAITPEPASAGLVGLALMGTGLLFRRRFSK